MYDVCAVKCNNYEPINIEKAMDELIKLIGGLDFVKPKMKIAIKANLVTFMKPEQAATTHPALLCDLVSRLTKLGAIVTVGDSPGGIYTNAYLKKIYSVTKVDEIEKFGGKLNYNFETLEAHFDNAKIAKTFPYTSYLDEADIIINFCKLKTHGMMGMSAAVKNMFGVIPGTQKPEFHYRYPDHTDFANMLIDLNEYFKPTLCFVDAIVGMEGNGPTAGTPRDVGFILASKNPYKLDLACAEIIGLKKEDVPTLLESYHRNLIPAKYEELNCNEDLSAHTIADYNIIKQHHPLPFEDKTKLFGKIATKALRSIPKLKVNECIGCGKCAEVCPVKAIKIKNHKAHIDRKKCITCFCCQEFCPKGAMKVHRTLIAKMLSK